MGRAVDFVGKVFGRLTVVSKGRPDRTGRTQWDCLCECGNFSLVRTGNLRNGCTNSCGCFRKEYISGRSLTHGQTHTIEYGVWRSLKNRCNNPRNKDFDNYGGRGIKVCGRWSASFEAFLEDMGVKPSPELSIDRINVNGNYEPSNCRWATIYEQANNKRPRKRA